MWNRRVPRITGPTKSQPWTLRATARRRAARERSIARTAAAGLTGLRVGGLRVDLDALPGDRARVLQPLAELTGLPAVLLDAVVRLLAAGLEGLLSRHLTRQRRAERLPGHEGVLV